MSTTETGRNPRQQGLTQHQGRTIMTSKPKQTAIMDKDANAYRSNSNLTRIRGIRQQTANYQHNGKLWKVRQRERRTQNEPNVHRYRPTNWISQGKWNTRVTAAWYMRIRMSNGGTSAIMEPLRIGMNRKDNFNKQQNCRHRKTAATTRKKGEHIMLWGVRLSRNNWQDNYQTENWCRQLGWLRQQTQARVQLRKPTQKCGPKGRKTNEQGEHKTSEEYRHKNNYDTHDTKHRSQYKD